MRPEDEYVLSFYEEISTINNTHNIKLVRHKESGNIYVRKELSSYDLSVFDILSSHHYEGIPFVHKLVEDTDHNKLIVIEDFINGRTLRNILDIKETLPVDQSVSVLCALCDILAPLHQNDPPLIHRDIKPENIIITDDSELYLVDFDASKLYSKGKTSDTELIGTRKYAAPEQYGFSQSDPRTDIYAIGKVGRELVTGAPDRQPEQPFSKYFSVIDKCTDMDPNDRYRTVKELKSALKSACPSAHISNDIPKPLSGVNSQRSDEIRRIHRESAALPGFRTGKLWKKITASLVYLFLALYIPYYLIRNVNGWNIKQQIFYGFTYVFVFGGWILLFNDYKGIAQRLPLTSSRNILLKCLGYYLYAMAVTLPPTILLGVLNIT